LFLFTKIPQLDSFGLHNQEQVSKRRWRGVEDLLGCVGVETLVNEQANSTLFLFV